MPKWLWTLLICSSLQLNNKLLESQFHLSDYHQTVLNLCKTVNKYCMTSLCQYKIKLLTESLKATTTFVPRKCSFGLTFSFLPWKKSPGCCATDFSFFIQFITSFSHVKGAIINGVQRAQLYCTNITSSLPLIAHCNMCVPIWGS